MSGLGAPAAEGLDLRALAASVEQDPRRAAALAGEALSAARRRGDLAEVSVAAAILGRARRLLGDVDLAALALRDALGAAQAASRPDLEADAHLALAGVLALGASAGAAFDHLARAAELGDEDVRHAADLQRAVLCRRFGRVDEALALFDAAVPQLERREAWLDLARVLANRGGIHGSRGNLEAAVADYERARRLFAEQGQEFVALQVLHNLGWAHANRGDVATALACFDATIEGFDRLGHDDAVPTLSRAEALLAAGLSADAAHDAAVAARRLLDEGNRSTAGEALLLVAQATRLDGDLDASARAAAAAQGLFEDLESTTWARRARLERLRTSHACGADASVSLDEVAGLVDELAAGGDAVGEGAAATLATFVCAERGAADEAAAFARRARSSAHRFGLIELELGADIATMRSLAASGSRRAALARAERALARVERSRTLLSSGVDVGVAAHMTSFASATLELVASGGRPFDVLWWTERLRDAVRLRIAPAASGGDPRHHALRAVSAEIRQTEAHGAVPADLLERRRRLEAALLAPAGRAGGDGSAEAHARSRALREALDRRLGDAAAVSFTAIRGTLVAVVLAGGRARRIELGDASDLAVLAERTRAAVQELADAYARGGSGVVARRRRAGELTGALGDRLVAPLRTGERTLVISPTAALASVPWGALAPCRAGVEVVPSLPWWSSVGADPAPTTGPVVAVAGPRLEHAADEARRVADCHGAASTTVTGRDASVEAVVAAFATARLVHVAAHGRIRHDNPFHSTLELADGPVSVLDLVRLERVPRTVVLASCGSGHVGRRAGEQLVGITSALLVAGAREVVVASGDLPDAPVTVDAMVDLHRRLAAGTAASAALADAGRVSGDPLADPVRASLIAVGAGRPGAVATPP